MSAEITNQVNINIVDIDNEKLETTPPKPLGVTEFSPGVTRTVTLGPNGGFVDIICNKRELEKHKRGYIKYQQQRLAQLVRS